MPIIVKIYIELSLILAAFLYGLYRFGRRERSLQWLTVGIGASLLTELTAFYFNLRFHNNLIVYQVADPFMLFCNCLYFNYADRRLSRRRIGWWAGALGFVFAVLNIILFQPLHTEDTLFWEFECLAMFVFSAHYFYTLISSDRMLFFNRDRHFWIAVLFSVFYLGTFLIRAYTKILEGLGTGHHHAFHAAYMVIFYLAVLLYVGLAVVLAVFRPKNSPA